MWNMDKKAVGTRIKELRRSKSMTQHQLAEKLFYSTERQLQRIENGEVVCTVDRLIEIAQIFHTSTDYILFGESIFDKEIQGKAFFREKDAYLGLIILEGNLR